jgi:hypothetical protein
MRNVLILLTKVKPLGTVHQEIHIQDTSEKTNASIILEKI